MSVATAAPMLASALTMYQRAAARTHGCDYQLQGGDMSHRKTLSRLTLASLVAAGLAAPMATAMPTDPGTAAVTDPRQADMHASTVTKSKTPKQDLRTEAAADPSRPPVGHPRLAGPPTWPENPQPIGRAQAQLAGSGGGGSSDDVPVELLIVGGALVLGGGMAATAVRLRARTAH
jgi:hypothetical protein